MKNKSYVTEIEDEGQAFTETWNTAEDFLITQNKHLTAGLWQQQQLNSNFRNNFIYLQNHLVNQG